MSLPKLPPAWEWKTVEEVGDVQLGRQRSPKYHSGPNMRPYLRVANVHEDRIDIADVKEMNFDPDEFERYRLIPGDILLNEGQSPEFLGRPAMYRGTPEDTAFTNSLIRFKAGPTVDPRWALLVFRRHMHFGRFTRESRITTNIAHLSAARFKTVEFPLPPIEEQWRIVDALEDHLSRLDATASILDTAARRAARLEQAFLELATRQGATTPLGDVTEIQGGIQKQPKRDPRENAFPFLRVANVTSTGLNLDDVHKIELFAGELERLRLRQGDLLVVEGNGSASQIGRAALWDGSIADCVHQNHLIRVRPTPDVLPEYLEAVWNSPGNRGKLARLASSSSGLYTLSVAKLKSLTIPVPTIEVQRALVAEVEGGRFAVSHALVAVGVAERRSGQLRRALLDAAFSGRLATRQPSPNEMMSHV